MLSDREQQTLREVQRQFETEDTGFTRSFDDVGQQHSTYSFHWAYAMPRWAYTTAIVVTVALGVLMCFVAAPVPALLFAAMTTMIWWVRKRRDEPGQRAA